MTILYSKLADVYNEIYQHIFNYDQEFNFYDDHLKNAGCKKIIEIGCGSGHLAQRFINEGYQYTGLDLSEEMLEIAKMQNEGGNFIQQDMRSMDTGEKYDAVIITGRSFAYITSNHDVIKTIQAVRNHLKNGGIFIFDNFNAEAIFGNFKTKSSKTIETNGKHFKRESESIMDLSEGWTWIWNAIYTVTENGKTKKYQDSAKLRAFTEDELSIFLKIHKFSILKAIRNESSLFFVCTV